MQLAVDQLMVNVDVLHRSFVDQLRSRYGKLAGSLVRDGIEGT